MHDQAKQHWNTQPAAALANPWFANKEIIKALYTRMTGQPKHWLAWLMQEYFKGRRFERMLSPGCGTGEHEAFVAKTQQVDQIDAFDFSDASLEIARKNAAGYEASVNFYQDDLNTFTLQHQYDAILCSGSVHHVREIERFFEVIHAACKPDARFILNEYVGACYSLYPERQVKILARLLEAIPPELRLVEKFQVDSLQTTLGSDPSESVRSALILPIMREYFTIEYRRDYSGSILHPMYRMLRHDLLATDEPKSRAIVRLLLEFEQIMLEEEVLPTDFTFCIAVPK